MRQPNLKYSLWNRNKISFRFLRNPSEGLVCPLGRLTLRDSKRNSVTAELGHVALNRGNTQWFHIQVQMESHKGRPHREQALGGGPAVGSWDFAA